MDKKILNNLDLDNNKLINVATPTTGTDGANKSYIDNRIITTNKIIVKQNPGAGEFSSIVAAIASIVGNTFTNRFLIDVEPGLYIEDTIVMKPYTMLKGSSRFTTTIQVNATNKHVIEATRTSSITEVKLQGATSSGFCAIHFSNTTTILNESPAFVVDNITFGNNDILMKSASSTSTTAIIANNLAIGSIIFTQGFVATGTNALIPTTISVTDMQFTAGNSTTDVVLASGPGTQIIISSSIVTKQGTVGQNAMHANNAGAIRLLSTDIRNYAKGIWLENSGAASSISAVGINMTGNTQDIVIDHPSASGSIQGVFNRTMSFLNPSSTVVLQGLDRKIIRVAKLGGDYNSVEAAVNSITDSDINNRYIVHVGPGEYTEPLIDLTTKPYISVVGDAIQAPVITPSANNHHIFSLGTNNELSFMWLEGSGPGYAGIAILDSGNYSQAHKVTFNNCDIGILITSVTQDTFFYGEYIDYNGNYSYGTKIMSSNGFIAFANLENYYNLPTGVLPTIGTYVSGANAQLDTLTTGQIGVGIGKAFLFEYGANVSISATNIENWDIGIDVPDNGSPNVPLNLVCTGVKFKQCNTNLIIDNEETNGYFVGYIDITKRQITDASSFFITDKDSHIITVAKKGGDFTSVYDATNFITNSSGTNEYLIKVGPGFFIENPIILPDFVKIEGSGILQTTIAVNDPSATILSAGSYTGISNLALAGATDPTGIAISFDGASATGVALCFVENILFNSNYTQIKVNAACPQAILVANGLTFGGPGGGFVNGVMISNNIGKNAEVSLDNIKVQITEAPFINFFGHITGTGNLLTVTDSEILGGGASSNAFQAEDGAQLVVSGTLVTGFDKAFHTINSGTGPIIQISGAVTNSNTSDLYIEHPGTTGTVSGVFEVSGIFIDPAASVGISLQDPANGSLTISNKLNIRFPNSTITDYSTLIGEGSTSGVLEGGELTNGGGFVVNIGDGYGYFEQFPDNDVEQRHDWINMNITLSANIDKYIYFNSNAILTSNSSKPDTKYNIILGRVVTNSTGIEFIDSAFSNAEHTSNLISDFAKQALGPIYSSGSIVSESIGSPSLDFHLDITQGKYFYGENVFNPNGGNNINFVSIYKDGIGGFIKTNTNVVDNSFYDNGTGTLAALTSGYYVKHSLYVVGEGVNEKYYLIYAQNQYVTLLDAQMANIPSTPTYIKDSVTLIAGIIVQQGASNITQVRDLRPVVGFKVEGVNASADHLSLLNLNTGDAGHHQFLMLDGSKPMVGNLDLGSNNILNVNNINLNDINSIPINSFYKNGRNTIGGNATIGLIDNFSLGISTNNIDRISISNGGVITIGNLSSGTSKILTANTSGTLVNGTWNFNSNAIYPLTDGSNIGLSGTNRVGTIFMDSTIDYVTNMNFSVGGVNKFIISNTGSVTTGTWSATPITTTVGGTNITSYTTGDTLYASASNILSKLSIGSTGQVLTVSGGVPVWAAVSAGEITLTNSHILVGNASNIGVDVAMSGNVTISNTGVTTIGSSQVTNSMLVNSSLTIGTTTISLGSTTSSLSTITLDNTNTITLKDTLFTLQDDGDVTKQLRFQLSGITTGTTKTLTIPNTNGTITLGTGTTNNLTRWSATNVVTNSQITDDGTHISITASGLLDLSAQGINISSTVSDIGIQSFNNITLTPSTSYHVRIDGDNSLQLLNASTFSAFFLNAGLTTDRNFTLPDTSGTFVVRDGEFENTTTTTNNTATTITTIATTSDTGYLLETRIVSRRVSGTGSGTNGDTNSYVRTANIKNVGGTVTIGTVQSSYTDEDITSHNVTITASGTNILIKVVGSTSNTVNWKAISEIIKLS